MTLPFLELIGNAIMRIFFTWCLAVGLLIGRSWAAEFRLQSGETYHGDVTSATEQGVVFRLNEGGFSPRVDYARFTDETLKLLAEDARTRKFVMPILAPPAEEKAIQEAKQITVKQPPRVERPLVKPGLFSALTTPNGMVLLALLYGANLFVAYSVARFRFQSVPLVCGISAFLPVVGPIVFLAMPHHSHAVAEVDHGPTPDGPGVAMAASSGENRVNALGMTKSAAGGGANDGLPKVFKRGDTTFNRRFFETQFPTFFRMVASDADRDLVLDIEAGKHSLIASRISRITANDGHFKTTTGAEVAVEFGLINSITLRHKDARA